MNILLCPLPLFQRIMRLLAENPQRPVFVRVGVHHHASDREWLARDVSTEPPASPASSREPVFRLIRGSTPAGLFPLPPAVSGSLYLGDFEWRGHLFGVVRIAEAIEPLHRLFLVGAGMHRLPIAHPQASEVTPPPLRRLPDASTERWSRTIGAMGGEAIWERLVSLKIGVVGCGRTGSLVAESLGRLGVGHLTLIDPDVVEPHNLGEMDLVTDADIGSPKAQAIAGHLEPLLSRWSGSPFPIVAPISHPDAIAQAKGCDVLVCCADNDAARLATALIATLHHKVLVDIGTGIHFTMTDDSIRNPPDAIRNSLIRNPQSTTTAFRMMGADVRLILPSDGCLICRGNLTDYAQAIEDLCNHRPPTERQGEWNRQRAGSLRTLNQLAGALAVQMLGDLVAERIGGSTWAQVEFDASGRLTVRYPPTPPPASPCPLCAKAGLGDEGL